MNSTQSGADQVPVTLITHLTATHSSPADLRLLLADLAAESPSEPGNLGYEVFAVEGDPLAFDILERWVSDADARRHADRVVDDGVVARAVELLAAPIETLTLAPITPAHPTSDSDGGGNQ